MARETELKMLIAPEQHQQVLALECLRNLPVVSRVLINTYFDTPDLALNRQRVALRIRALDGGFIQTLKTKGESHNGLSRRNEWEWQLSEPKLDMARLAEVWPAALQGVAREQLAPVFQTNFERRLVNIEWQGADIELALDFGKVVVGDQSALISELELELKQGPEAALHSLAQTIGDSVPWTPGDISKAEQGYRLAATTAAG